VVGPLIEVPIMLTLVWIAMRTGQRLFARAAAPEAVPQPNVVPSGPMSQPMEAERGGEEL